MTTASRFRPSPRNGHMICRRPSISTPVLALLGILVAMVPAGCKQHAFEGRSPEKSEPVARPSASQSQPPETGTSADNTAQKTATFVTQASTGMLDLVWAVDTSGSMMEEIDNVKTNLVSLLQGARAYGNLRFALLGSGLGVEDIARAARQALGDQALHVPAWISSHNSLRILIDQLCAPGSESRPLYTNQECMAAAARQSGSLLDFFDEGFSAGDELVPFLRPEASRVFVVVTDDNASRGDEKRFASLLNGSRDKAFFFAFRSFSAAFADASGNCFGAAVGTAYQTLSDDFSGQNFDICAPDWSQHFQTLLRSVQKIANRDFTIAGSGGLEIVSVSVDGKQLAPSAFSQIDRTVILSSDVLTSAGLEVRVVYRDQKPDAPAGTEAPFK